MTAVVINSLKLPGQLVTLIKEGRWMPPGRDQIERVFGAKVLTAEDPRFYSLEYLPFENEGWYNETMPVYLGIADADNPPGDIDPHKSILIGDIGIDLPFALDYRENPDNPRVVFLDLRTNNKWITIAKNFKEFANALNIDTGL